MDISNYTATSGSTIVALKPTYLETLAIGTHTITFHYSQELVETSFGIEKALNQAVEESKSSETVTPTKPVIQTMDTVSATAEPITATETSSGSPIVQTVQPENEINEVEQSADTTKMDQETDTNEQLSETDEQRSNTENKKEDIPKTGDMQGINICIFWITLIGSGIIGTVIYKRKIKNS